MAGPDDALARLVGAVRQSPKYGRVCAELVRHIGADELARRRNLKDAVKATKNRLHQVGGAYLGGGMDYARWLEMLRDAAAAPGPDALRDACRAIMRQHASTRERLPILDEFYAALFAGLGPVRTVLDVACGLNPLAIPWMPLAPGAAYYAYDIYHDMIDFLNAFLPLAGVAGRASARDVSRFVPPERADVALILKTLPCLEQIDRAAGLALLDAVNADHVIVSFPVRSLGGFEKGMIAHYEARLGALLAGRAWPVRRYAFATELAFVVSKSGRAAE